jgi:Protein of unknown function (DUF2933)
MTTEQPREAGSWFRSRSGLVLVAFLVIAGFFLVTEHAAHLLGVLPYLLLLACPLLHFFHRGHGSGHDGHGGGNRASNGGDGR